MTQSRITIFLSIISIILAIGAFAIYQGFVFSFDLTGSSATSVSLIIYILTFGFIGMSVFGSSRYNFFTHVFYTLTAIWMGLFAYLLIASCAVGLYVLFWVPSSSIAQISLLLAVPIWLYGLVHARSLKVKKISVTLQNLPEIWRGKKILWASDLHLGQVYGGELVANVVKKIREASPDIVFIGGDLFDGTAFDPDVLEPFTKLHVPHGIVFITGNHEEFRNTDNYLAAIRTAGMRVLIDEKMEIDGLQILGVDYHNNVKTEDFARRLSDMQIDRNKPSILLKHEPKDIDVTEAAGISLQISGHTHRAQIWPFRNIPRRIYKGFDYGLKRSGDTQVITSSGAGTWGPPLRVGTDSEVVLIIVS